MSQEQQAQPIATQILAQQGEDAAIYRQGITQGVLAYLQVHQGKAISGRQIYEFLMKMLLNTTHPSLWNAGYLMGWTKAYHQGYPWKPTLPEAMLPEQAYQQEIARLLDYIKNGELTLHEAANIAEGLALTTDF